MNTWSGRADKPLATGVLLLFVIMQVVSDVTCSISFHWPGTRLRFSNPSSN